MKWKWMVLVLLLLTFSLWCPWINEPFAKSRAISGFHSAWKSTVDGCGSNKPIASKKIPFGRLVEIEYSCGLLPPEPSPDTYKRTTIFVSFLGTVHIDKTARPD